MNKVIILSELAASVAELTQSSPEEAENFIRETFRLAAEELEAEGKVEIPGIGTFILTEESVAFAPDAAIAEELNAPFSAFEAIELPDEEADEEIEADVEEVIETEPQPQGESVDGPTEEQQTEEIAEAAEFEEREDAAPEPEPEPQPEPEPEPEDEAEAEPVTAAMPPEYRPAQKSGGNPWAWYGWAASCIACLALGWFARDFVPQPPVAEREIAVVEQTAAADNGSEAAETIEVQDEQPAQPVEPVQTSEPEPTITDTITSQRYLTTMARAHYGRMEFWVYIYEANAGKLGHPDRLSAGTVVVIPSASSLGLDPDNEAQIAAAERKAREIYARFN